MTTVVWVSEGTWPGCVDAARTWVPAEDEVLLLYVGAAEVPEVVSGALAGLMGRGRGSSRAPRDVERLSDQGAADVLAAAAQRLARPARTEIRRGRVEREVVAAAEAADLLIVARDGDRSRLGPRSLGPHIRFVVDHAPCPVLLVWPDDVPAVTSIPPPPPTGPPPGHRPPR